VRLRRYIQQSKIKDTIQLLKLVFPDYYFHIRQTKSIVLTSLQSIQFVDLLKQNETHNALKLLGSDKLSKSGKVLVMKNGKPKAVPTSELANLLIHSNEEICGEKLDFCTMETRNFIAEFLCKDIEVFKNSNHSSAEDFLIKIENDVGCNLKLSKRKRDRKFDSKLEVFYKQVCVGLDNLNEQ